MRIFGVYPCGQRAIGEAITARSIAIDYYQGLGPPDLCCVTKQVLPAVRVHTLQICARQHIYPCVQIPQSLYWQCILPALSNLPIYGILRSVWLVR